MAKLQVTVTVDEERLKELRQKLNELKRLIPIRIQVTRPKEGAAAEKKEG